MQVSAGAPVLVGVVLLNYGTVGQQLRVKGLSTGQTRGQAQAVVTALNREGGIDGHRIKPIFYTSDITNGTYSSQAQAICSAFTEDHHVFAVIGSGVDMTTLAACLADHATPFIPSPWLAASVGFFDDAQLARFGRYFFYPNLLDPRAFSAAVDHWATDGFLTSVNKIGIIRADEPQNAWTSQYVVRPRLAAHGLKVTDEVAIQVNNSVSDISGPAAQTSNAVLRFKAEGIDRVLWIPEGTGGEAFFFMPEADNQNYHPKYGISSWVAPYFLESNESASQLAGSEGLGWQPTVDVDLQHQPSATPGRQACLAMLRPAGEANFADPGVANAAYAFCESFTFLRDALKNARQLTVAALQAGVQTLGSSFPSVLTFGERFGPGREGPVTSGRWLRYDTRCSCYTYVGPRIALR